MLDTLSEIAHWVPAAFVVLWLVSFIRDGLKGRKQ